MGTLCTFATPGRSTEYRVASTESSSLVTPEEAAMAGSYRDLVAWQKGLDLVVEIYRITERFPKSEMYGLTSQLRRAAVSVPSNIAEGQAHFSKQEFRHFLRHSRGSLAELETQ